jgi:hypothetical protein
MDKPKKRKWFLIVLVVIIAIIIEVPIRNAQIRKEKTNARRYAAIAAIDEAIKSLSNKPNQFSLLVKSTGLSVVQSGSGGTGMNVTVTGGGPGSKTTGLNVSMDGHDIQIVQQAATQALSEESQKAIQILQDLKKALSEETVESEEVDSLLAKLRETYVPVIISSIITKLITFGL